MSYSVELLRQELERDEGVRRLPYRDTEGKLTIGIGWNLEANGLPAELIERLYELAVDEAETTVARLYPEWRDELTDARQRVLVNMAFNLGLTRLQGFAKMWRAIKTQSYATAALEMLDSKWAGQVGARADRLAAMMRDG